MKNEIEKSLLTIEHHCLNLAYEYIRLHNRNKVEKLARSIEACGQLTPVSVINTGPQQWVLIDGYLRVKALKRIGIDTIHAESWSCSEGEALLALLREKMSGRSEIIEESLILRELHQNHQWSQSDIARYTGKDKSWVSRRLALIEHLPEEMLKAVLQEKISLWVAQRILLPLARANPLAAEKVFDYLLKQHVSSREIQRLFEYYQQANRQDRTKVIDNIELFFKAQREDEAEKRAIKLKIGPEGKWCGILKETFISLKQLPPLVDTVFYPRQAPYEREALLKEFKKTQSQFMLLTEKIRSINDDKKGPTSNDYLPT